MSTVESSFKALNIKKFDVTLVADPLYHQTSAQLNDGGAKGLVLNNLGVYGGCQPLIGFGLYVESLEQTVVGICAKNEICPTPKEIFYQFDENNHRSSLDFNISQNADLKTDAFNGANFDTSNIYHNDNMGDDHENMSFGDLSFHNHHRDSNSHTSNEADVDDRFEKVSTFSFQGLGLEKNLWAGPDHWKYWRPKGSEEAPATPSRPGTKRSKNTNHKEVELNFTAPLDDEIPNIFAVPKSSKSLLQPTNRVPVSNRLPDDCHYQPENLIKLFLLPSVLVMISPCSPILYKSVVIHDKNIKERWRFCRDHDLTPSIGRQSGVDNPLIEFVIATVRICNHNFDEALPSWDNESVLSGQYYDGCIHSDVEDSDTLASPPRQVSKIEFQYDRTSKQVDVHALKETLWGYMQESAEAPTKELKDNVSFKHILATFPVNSRAAAAQDITPHLCFICLLHLANDHGLSIHDCPTLDDVSIHLPSR
ncbi:condensin complex subunit 2-like [Pyrus ussuriensis x Pyrus communis]|uniref:Condensin complex subunit 2-like n=1 Tax=Pyrus ussuriensis x Pyrus communis TaxID=2448454 RepID=A0A5N5GP13_9ROSA|nr:condensin complex subunit 2-like [Pyrus ussuriensis x Pyrus communis]